MFVPGCTSWLPWMLKFCIVLIMAALSQQPEEDKQDDVKRIQIVVLGDIGRSPRMQYHALSIAKHGGHAELVGYLDSDLHTEISANGNIRIHPLMAFPGLLKSNNRILFAVLGPLKVIFQVWTLWSVLYLKAQRSDWMLIQNPPSIPTLVVALLVCWMRNTRLVIDWHNFGYSILSLKLGPGHPLVRLSQWYERLLGRYASEHICVTDAMAKVLRDEYRIRSPVLTLHDRPASSFQILDEAEKSRFLERLPELLVAAVTLGGAGNAARSPSGNMNVHSKVEKTGIATPAALIQPIKSGATKLLVSSTSWTPDEDFGLLLEALEGYCQESEPQEGFLVPEVLVIITGKGPQRATFEAKARLAQKQGKLSHAFIMTAYFDDIGDYAKLLGCADLGISLHTSSSGVDLPMKVVDMFGTGLPVVGWGNFEAWPELVKENHNGMAFSSAGQLQTILKILLRADSKILKRLKRGALEEGRRRWNDEWDPVAGRLFNLVNSKKSMKDRG